MISTQDINQNLFDLLTTKNFELVTRDNKGKETANPKEAELFSFDYTVDDTNYGTVVVTITSDGSLEVFYGDSLGKGMELDHKSEWYDFLYQLRHFARRNMLGFDLKNMNKLKYAMQSRSQVEESKYYGYKNTSYTKPTKEAKLKIVHSKPIDEEAGDQRYRNIKALYVENADGERFKLPFTKLFAGRAMARHVSEGGSPHDHFGQYICELVSDIGVLANFVRASRGKEFTDAGTSVMAEAGVRHYADLKKKVKRMIGRRGYKEQFDSFDPTQTEEHVEITDQLRDMFTETLLDTRIEEAIPVLNRLESRNSVMKEITEFNDWAEGIATPEDATCPDCVQDPCICTNDLEEGFDPDEFDGEITVGDGEEVYYHAEVDKEQNTVHVTKCSDEQYADECQADAEAEWDARDNDVPAYEGEELDEGAMKELHYDLENASDEEFEATWKSKKSDWQEVKTPGLAKDPNKPAYISKMKKHDKNERPSDWASAMASEDKDMEVYEGPTRKDFQMVADLLKANPDQAKKKELANHHADMFAKQNPRFDKERFLKAAGIEEGNDFTEKLAQARQRGEAEFEVDGKTYKVQEDELKAILRLAR